MENTTDVIISPKSEIDPSNLIDREYKVKSNTTIIILSVLCLALTGIAIYLYLFPRTTPSITQEPSSTQTPSIISTASPDPTAGWQTYTDPNGQFIFRYPPQYKLDTTMYPYLNENITWRYTNISATSCKGDCPTIESKENTILGNLPAYRLSGYIGEVGGNIAQRYITYEVKTGAKYFDITLRALPYVMTPEIAAKYPANKIYPINDEDKKVFDQILSTFKFVDSVSQPQTRTNYIVPTTWQQQTTQNGLKLCLPPKWGIKNDSELIFNRDTGYQPTITVVSPIPYQDGSTRAAYFSYWSQEYPNVQSVLSAQDVDINGNKAIIFIPTGEPKTSPEGLAVIWYAVGKLWKAGLSNWNMANTSEQAFLKDFYTMISCSF